jgi:hypothetical protein
MLKSTGWLYPRSATSLSMKATWRSVTFVIFTLLSKSDLVYHHTTSHYRHKSSTFDEELVNLRGNERIAPPGIEEVDLENGLPFCAKMRWQLGISKRGNKKRASRWADSPLLFSYLRMSRMSL